MTASSDESAKPLDVTLVIPGRNCSATLRRCLDSVVPLLEAGQLGEVVFVDDGSTDDTRDIANEYPVRILEGTGRGPGYARNLGWRSASTSLVWFIDSDCVAEPDALSRLIVHLDAPDVGGVGGSYGNLHPDSLVASLIHAEIVARHRRMPREIDFLATFNVVYRRAILDEVGGFDESLKLAQDAELAFRIVDAGHRLRFEIESRVGHHHPTRLFRYLQTQARQGYYRILLYRKHPGKATGDSYAGIIDYLQPPLSLAAVASLALIALPSGWLLPTTMFALLFALQLPMTVRMLAIDWRCLSFPPFAAVRALARAIGAAAGVLFDLGTRTQRADATAAATTDLRAKPVR